MTQINVKNRTIFCLDNLKILRNINSASVDLIYMDPPFNKKRFLQHQLVHQRKELLLKIGLTNKI